MIEKYPYTDFNEYNLDWIIREIRKLHKDWSDFQILNTIRFEGIWDITKQYPAWSLVTDNNVGYISVQPVPAGVDISETDYWKEVYNYSTIIPDIMNRIVALENRATSDEADIAANAADIDRLQNRKILIIGDSYNTGTGGGQTINTMTPELAATMQIPQSSIYNYATGGAGFCRNADDPGASFEGVLLDAVSGMTSAEKKSITDIFIIGGANDGNIQLTTLVANLNRFDAIATANYPNAKIQIFAVGWSYDPNNRRALLFAYDRYDLIKYPVTRLYYILQKKGWMYDSYHPNEEGITALAHAIGVTAMGGKYAYNSYTSCFFKFGDSTNTEAFTWFDENNVYLKFTTFPAESTIAYNISYSRSKCGTGDFPLNYGWYSEDGGLFEFPIHVIMLDTSNNFKSGKLLMSFKSAAADRLSDYTMDVYLKSFETDSNALLTFSNIKKIYFGGETIVFPIDKA